MFSKKKEVIKMHVNFKSGKSLAVINDELWGVKISKLGLDNQKLDYLTMINALTDKCYFINNNIIDIIDDFEQVNGDAECDAVYQYYIVCKSGASYLQLYTEVPVYYSESADLYLFGVTHYGTEWDYVLTDYELKEN